jgi:hypothetical protein
MIVTVIDFRSRKLQSTVCTSEGVQASPDFPENVTPGHTLLPKEDYKLVDLKATIWNMLCNHVSMEIDKNLCLFSCHPFTLVRREKG